MAINYIEISEFTNYSCSNYRKSMLTVDVIGNDDFLTWKKRAEIRSITPGLVSQEHICL